jgi:hypothetical protein
MSDNPAQEQKNILVIRAPLSEDGYASIYFWSNDGRLMNEREWWNLKQMVEMASKACAKSEPKAQAAAAGG